jgi:hypothetical protein
MGRHRVIEPEDTGIGETNDHRGDHRLGQRSSAERRVRCDRLTRANVRDSPTRHGRHTVAKHSQHGSWHRVLRGVLTQQGGQIELTHAPTLSGAATITPDTGS